MELLGVEQLDLMQIHNLLDWRTHLSTLRDWKAAGTIRYVGVTHYTASAHAELADVLRREPVDFVQINYSIEEPEAATGILPLAADKGIAVIVNRPFGGGGTVRRLAGQAVAGMGGGVWMLHVVAGAVEVGARAAGGNVRHPGHRPGGSHD